MKKMLFNFTAASKMQLAAIFAASLLSVSTFAQGPGGRQQQPITLGPDDVAAFPAAPAGFDVARTNIPHGKIDTITYNSKSVGNDRKMLVYTPPGYSKSKTYPVLYLLP